MPRGTTNNLIGERFGNLVVLSLDGKDDKNNRKWLCQCDCGNTKVILGLGLKSGGTTSCGCVRDRLSSERKFIHGQSRKTTYRIWDGMRRRCNDPQNSQYKWYGGKGIKVCDKWLKFSGFFEDMGIRPDGLTIDRIDSNGNYEPSNCRWVTMTDNLRNRNCVKLNLEKAAEIRMLLNTTKLSQKDIAAQFNIDPSVISNIKHNKYWVT